MTATQNATQDRQSRETASSSPLGRRTTSSTFSSGNNRFSEGSSDTGESSLAASNRNSLITSGLSEADGDRGGLDVDPPVKDGRGSHRSHKSKSSGGFLLSNAAFDPPTDQERASASDSHSRPKRSTRDAKGKAVVRSPEKKHSKRRSNIGASVGSSPLAGNVTNAAGPDTGNGLGGDSTADRTERQDGSTIKATVPLDVDSAQIVNLALNLSESRRNASRRVISTPLPPPGESFTGGSLRQHLQQQRRVSRNISPKPDRGERAMTSSPRIGSSQRIHSPLQGSFDSQDGPYQYRFSASTLARAEKAKNAIELMAQYRRLLQYVPPLKPQAPLERTTTSNTSDTPGSPVSPPSRTVSYNTPPVRQLGRPYNPLQYIRNRKVRSRTSRAIDGEAQGFGDLEKVTDWIDRVSSAASSEDYQAADCPMLPQFSQSAELAASPHQSPGSTAAKNSAQKVKRPRVDWITNPADMIADVFWLEQDDNKRLIENRHGRLLFPPTTELKRPVSRRSDEPEPKKSPTAIKAEDLGLDLRLDTKLPEFKSVKSDPDKGSDSAPSRVRRKLRDVRDAARIPHGHNGSLHRRFRSVSRSSSSSSDSEDARPRRRRSGTTDSHDREKDILEKQMMEMLAKEAKDPESFQDIESRKIIQSIEEQHPRLKNGSGSGGAGHSRSASLVERQKRDSAINGSSGRASLEVPGSNPRGSLDELNTTAPNSPQSRATKIKNAFIPSIGMDLSHPKSRPSSPTRRPLSKVRSKIRPLYERNQYSSQGHDDNVFGFHSAGSKEQTPDSPDTQDPRRRSMSPVKKVLSRATDDSLRPKKSGSIRKAKPEDSGIRGLFKARNPVSRVSDYIWKKESPVPLGTSSGFSTDESDMEDIRKSDKKGSRESSADQEFDDLLPVKERKSYQSDVPPLPVFTSPFDRRGRTGRANPDELSPEPEAVRGRRKYPGMPRIDVQNASPTSSPDTNPADCFQRDSSVSDVDSRRNSVNERVYMADARLNSILGLPGKRRNALPITGLSGLDTSDHRPSLDGKRQWSISDRDISQPRGPMTMREIARVRALLLSSGIKAKEISRRAAEMKDLKTDTDSPYTDIAALAKNEIKPVPKSQEHRLAARILSDDVQLSSQMWQDSANVFVNEAIPVLLDRIATLQSRLVDNLTPMTRTAADDADEVSKDLVTSQTLKVKRISDKIDKMTRRRRRRFRWLRRGGWVIVEWALVGIMWYVWFMVVIARVFMGIGKGVVGSLRWLFWL